ncbi:hypothetical protein NDGK_01207 [Clostridiales bacterium CHKCI001]|nr:hypothetical protein NDGK_01207 [Clostridiales bacterium CHKCI001]
MSLSVEKKITTSRELRRNYKILGMDPQLIQNDLGFTEQMLLDTLNVTSSTTGVNIWKLRDYMNDKIKEQGKKPAPYSILKYNIRHRYKKTW